MQVLVISTFTLGLLVALQAVAFVIVIRGTGVLNFAQGSVLALGAYLVLTVELRLGIPPLPAIAAMLVLMGVLGVVLYVVLLRRLQGAPVWAVLVSLFGLDAILIGAIQAIWGTTDQYLVPLAARQRVVLPGGLPTDVQDIIVSAMALGALALVLALVYRTPLGLRMRASADAPDLASYAGISVRRVGAISWALSLALAGLAGTSIAVRSSLTPELSAVFLTAFPAVLIGGLESILGAVVGSFLLALILTTGVVLFGSETALPLAYGMLLVVLIVRPYGLFGARDIVRV